MCMIERPFMDAMPDYDHYSFADVTGNRWQAILTGLSDFKTKLVEAQKFGDIEDQFCCIWPGTKESFADNFGGNRKKLIELIDEFTDWVNQTLHDYESIAVLGM